ncbi:MAG: DUF4142 domain-containing protein [Bacteroidetes bacterium]|nr:DUF4142 domain-containing protein [Bacteroidota bacterium]MBS1685699.1 DUF4142 domain-containing protein [Bacteroidota bacterium]
MKSRLILLALCSSLTFAACQNKPTADMPMTTIDTFSHTGDSAASVPSGDVAKAQMEDSAFLADASQTGVFEIEAGKLAEQNSQNADVKAFAKMMIDQHTAMGKDVDAMAGSKGITLPVGMGDDNKKEWDKLNNLKGAKFDKEYVSVNIDGHRKAIDLFDKTSKNEADSKEVRDLAAAGLPKLQMHQEHAKNLKDKVK